MRPLPSIPLANGFLAFIFTIGVFALDSVTPLGYAVPILYLIPLALIGLDYWAHGIFWYAAGATVLAVAGYFVGPEGGQLAPAIFNRMAAVIVLWGAAWLLSSEKRSEWRLGRQADLNRAILDAVAAHITLIDRRGEARELGAVSLPHAPSHESGFIEALRSPRWQEVMSRCRPCDPIDPDDHLAGVWDVVQGRRSVYSAEYGRMTPSGFRWFLLYASMLRSREGAVVAHIDMTARREAQQALQKREREIQLLLDAREALARDLHDEVIQRLYALGLKLSAWRRRMGEAGSPVASRFGEVIFDVDQVMHQVRGYIDGTPRSVVEGQDLPRHVEQMIGSMITDTPVTSDLAVDAATASQLAPTHVAQLLAMIREGVSNALQHAGAQHVHVSLQPGVEHAELVIRDDGHGFDVELAAAGRGRGLANLRARAAAIGGQMVIRSAPGHGTSVIVHVPLEVNCDVH